MTLQSHFGNFNIDILKIKFLYGNAGREYGGEVRICQNCILTNDYNF